MDVDLISLLVHRPTNWGVVMEYLRDDDNRGDINGTEGGQPVLRIIRQRLECDGAPLKVQLQLIEWYPQYLAFSLFLCATRFPSHSTTLIRNILNAIRDYSVMNMDYCITKFHGDSNKEKDDNTVIGEAMTLLFSFFDDYIATPQSGNLGAIQIVKQKYPKSILYSDAHDFTPLHGACCSLNMDIFRFFIDWHLEQNPKGRGGLYEMNDSGITSLDTLIDTQSNIVHTLNWLKNRGLLKSKDVDDWLLIHRAAHSSAIENIRFFIDLLPSGVLSEDDNGNLPIHLHLGLRYRQEGTFSDQDLEIVRLFISKGIINGGIDTIGGLFSPDPDADNSCTLDALLKEVGESNQERIWAMIDDCLRARGEYFNPNPIVHAAILNKTIIPDELFEEILERYSRPNAHINLSNEADPGDPPHLPLRNLGDLLNGNNFNNAVVIGTNLSSLVHQSHPTQRYNEVVRSYKDAYKGALAQEKSRIVGEIKTFLAVNNYIIWKHRSTAGSYVRVQGRYVVNEIKSSLRR